MLTRILMCWTLGSAVSAKMAVIQTPEDSYIVNFKGPKISEPTLQKAHLNLQADDGHTRRRRKMPKNDCVTVDGPNVGATCVSPWKFVPTNKTYHGCTYDTASEPWCSTKVNENGYHLAGNWGVCPTECPVEKIDPQFDLRECPTQHGHKCFFPFHAEGFNYRGCIGASGNGHGYCYAEDKEDSSVVVKDNCTEACPKDKLLTNDDYTAGQILHNLMKESQTSTRVSRRKQNCKAMLEMKFAEEDPANLPLPARNAKTWTEALIQVCAGADYCKGDQPDGICGTYHTNYRANILEEENGVTNTPKSDCAIKCGNPND